MSADDAQIRKQAVDALIKAVGKKTAFFAALAAAGALLFGLLQPGALRWLLLPASIIFGGLLGLLNFRWLAIAVQRVYLKQGATSVGSNMAAVVISVLKLALIFLILFAAIKWRLVHILGLVAGLSLCFLAIIWEGVMLMQQNTRSDDKQTGC